MSRARAGTSRTVLVTGAAGFIGAALCRRLRRAGDRIIGYDDLSRGRREHVPADIHLVQGDIRDGARLTATTVEARPDCVIHLAAMHFIPDCIARPKETFDVNVEGTRSVLESASAAGVPLFLFASTAAVYAPTPSPCAEDVTPVGPLEVYGESKLAAEQLVAGFGREHGIATCALRFFNAVGRDETNPHVVPHIFESLRRSDVIMLGDVTPRRDYVNTRDIAEAIAVVADQSKPSQTLNVGTGIAHSVHDIIELVRGILRRDITVKTDASRLRTIDRPVLVADTARIHQTTGWTPRISLQDTLRDLALAYGLQTTPHPAGQPSRPSQPLSGAAGNDPDQ